MAERLDYPVGDTEFGANQQITRSATIPTRPAGVNYTNSGTLTVSTTAVTFPGGDTLGKDYALISVETDKVRFRFGSPPTSTAGHELNVGDFLELDCADELASIQFIRSGAADATLQVSYGVRNAE